MATLFNNFYNYLYNFTNQISIVLTLDIGRLFLNYVTGLYYSIIFTTCFVINFKFLKFSFNLKFLRYI